MLDTQSILECIAVMGGLFLCITNFLQLMGQRETNRAFFKERFKFDEALTRIAEMILALKSERRN